MTYSDGFLFTETRASSGRVSLSSCASERFSMERNVDSVRRGAHQRSQPGSPWKNSINPSMESIDIASGPLSARNSVSEDEKSFEMAHKNLDFSIVSDSSRGDYSSPLSTVSTTLRYRKCLYSISTAF